MNNRNYKFERIYFVVLTLLCTDDRNFDNVHIAIRCKYVNEVMCNSWLKVLYDSIPLNIYTCLHTYVHDFKLKMLVT